MTVRRARDVRQALLDKGMESNDNHHVMYRKTVEGVTQIVTRISHDAKNIDDGLGGMMAKQCCLKLKEFWELVDCSLTEEDWDAKVRDRCAGGRNPYIGR
ncbi:MAG: hypothetical protein AVDCRST_MAG93-5502 [uncultured Chloroflexia bacterium]|uniref:Uncharacterized protein n=1 Tax=uncultured Chloroflexia bacterium TaxID=1672391 RepID=A0A6J4KWX5_9CHLR|nr:MAG: hypothetical protein AVDCRST_MAG93-5502 [uncultured Chloroflexia bacterium]